MCGDCTRPVIWGSFSFTTARSVGVSSACARGHAIFFRATCARAAHFLLATGALIIDAAVMDHDDGAAERLADSINRLDVGAHVLVAALAAGERAVEGIDHNDGATTFADLGTNFRDQHHVLGR